MQARAAKNAVEGEMLVKHLTIPELLAADPAPFGLAK